MAQGLQLWDESGNNILDTNKGTVKILKYLEGNFNVTFSHPLLETETPFYLITPPMSSYEDYDYIGVTFNGSTCTAYNTQYEQWKDDPRYVKTKYSIIIGVY